MAFGWLASFDTGLKPPASKQNSFIRETSLKCAAGRAVEKPPSIGPWRAIRVKPDSLLESWHLE